MLTLFAQESRRLPSMTFFKVNERQYIELSRERQPNTDRLNHISIETDNAEAMRVYLASKGINVPDRVPKGRIGNSNSTVKDPEGHRVEIVQYEPDSWTVTGERQEHASFAELDTKPYRKEYQRTLEMRVGTNRKRQVNVFDPDGTRTELMEPVTIGRQLAPSSTAAPPE